MIKAIGLGFGMLISSVVIAADPPRLGNGPEFTPSNGPSTRSIPRTSESQESKVLTPFWDRPVEGDLPAADIRTVPAAAARATEAKWVHQQLMHDLRLATRTRMIQLESQPEYRQALAEEASAWENLQNARRRALAGLSNNDAYQASLNLRHQLSEQIRDLYFDSEKPDMERISAMAHLKLAYVSDNRKLETDALARDSDYQQARARYMAAAQRVREFRETHALVIAGDESLISLRRAVAQTRIAKLSALSYLKEAKNARNLALDYAGYYRSVDRYRPIGYGGWYELGGYYPLPR